MDLKKFLPGLEEKEKIEHYWALVIEPGWVQAGIWRIQNRKAQVIYTSTNSAWEVDEDLVNACDSALSSAVQNYPEGYEEPSKTVFGVSYDWVSGGNIKPEFLEKIKKVCRDLSLNPVGFVVLPEAISHLIKSEEGTPLNAIILGVYKESIEISLFQLGKLVGTTQVARSVSLTDDTVEGISRLSDGDMLPSRFLVYDGREGDLEDIRQTLINSNWEDYENIKFLHTPKVELIDTRKKIYSVALAGASEIANVDTLEDVIDKNETIKEGSDVPLRELAENKEVSFSENETVSPEELGFALEKDVGEVQEEVQKKPLTEQVESAPPQESQVGVREESNLRQVKEDIFSGGTALPKRKFNFGVIKGGLISFFSPLQKFKIRTPGVSAGKKPLLFGIIFLLLIFVSGALLWWFMPKATVIVYVSPQKLSEDVELTVDTKVDKPNISEKVVTGELLQTTVSGERTADTTGVKTIGDKAKGEITIYRVGPELSLPAGTSILGPEKLKFSLDRSISVASGSGITSPGVTKASVTASDIGAQYNLASGTTFTLGNYSTSDMEAKNESAFSGGSSKEVGSVSKDDHASLQADLESELKDKAESQLTEKITGDNFFIKDSQKTESTNIEYDHKIGDEAKTLKLILTVISSAVSVNKNDLTDIARDTLKDKIPKGFALRDEQLTYDFISGEPDGDKYKFRLKISANLLPQISTDEISKNIAGRYSNIAESYLKNSVPGFVRAEIKIIPVLPGRLKTLPHVIKNIDVELSSER